MKPLHQVGKDYGYLYNHFKYGLCEIHFFTDVVGTSCHSYSQLSFSIHISLG